MHHNGRVFTPQEACSQFSQMLSEARKRSRYFDLIYRKYLEQSNHGIECWMMGMIKKYCTKRKEFQFGKTEKNLQKCGPVAV